MQIEAAVSDALKAGRALCKTISRNDVGATGGHQQGFYLPKSVWQMFSERPPIKGTNHKTLVQVQWPEGIRTESAITWYGTGTRSELLDKDPTLEQWGAIKADVKRLVEHLVWNTEVTSSEKMKRVNNAWQKNQDLEQSFSAVGLKLGYIVGADRLDASCVAD